MKTTRIEVELSEHDKLDLVYQPNGPREVACSACHGTSHVPAEEPSNGCVCTGCREACMMRPGWLAPEDIAPLAALLRLTPQELFDRHLGADWWEEDDGMTWIVAPATTSMTPGLPYPEDPLGRCVFFTDKGLCEVHAAKPEECRRYMHDVSAEQQRRYRLQIRDRWRNPEAQRLVERLMDGKEG